MAEFLTSATAPAMRRSSRSLPPSRISKQEGHCDRKEGKTVLFMLDLSKIEKKKIGCIEGRAGGGGSGGAGPSLAQALSSLPQVSLF